MQTKSIKKLSVRDPEGSLFEVDGKIIRLVRNRALPDFRATLESPTFMLFQEAGKLASTRLVTSEESKNFLEDLSQQGVEISEVGRVVEHEKVPFVSYPFEWSPQMLHAAGALTMDLATRLLPEGLGLRDATPYNILFNGPHPVMVDVLSLEKRIRGDATWKAFVQYTQTFLNPLLLNKYFNLALNMILLPQRHGVDSEEIYQMCSLWQRWRQPFFSLVTVPHLLNRLARHWKPKKKEIPAELLKPERARFILVSLFRYLRRLLREVQPETRSKYWSGYLKKERIYTSPVSLMKQEWVEGVLREFAPKTLLDIGCHTGHYSRMAAKEGAEVLAIDSDPHAIDESWRLAREVNLRITSLVINIASPSPAIGWQNTETKSFLERATGQFDMVLLLDVLPQLSIQEGLPLTEILSVASQLTRSYVALEFVGPEDASVKSLVQLKAPKEAITEDLFERKAQFSFDIVKRTRLHGTDRILYLLRKKKGLTNSYAT